MSWFDKSVDFIFNGADRDKREHTANKAHEVSNWQGKEGNEVKVMRRR